MALPCVHVFADASGSWVELSSYLNRVWVFISEVFGGLGFGEGLKS